MTAKKALFVAEYLVDLNATEAAKRCGYSLRTAYAQGHRLLKDAEISAAIAEGQAKRLATAELSATRVLEELRRLAFADLRTLFDASGNLKPISELTVEEAACIGGFEVIKKNAEAGDGIIDTVHKVKVLDKTRSLEMLAKHFALLTEVVRVDDDAARINALMDGRRRAADARKAPPNDTSPRAGH